MTERGRLTALLSRMGVPFERDGSRGGAVFDYVDIGPVGLAFDLDGRFWGLQTKGDGIILRRKVPRSSASTVQKKDEGE